MKNKNNLLQEYYKSTTASLFILKLANWRLMMGISNYLLTLLILALEVKQKFLFEIT